MKHINVFRPLASGIPASTFESAKALACSVAESDPELLEPELIGRRADSWF